MRRSGSEMDIHARFGAVVSNDIWWRRSIKQKSSYLSSPSYPPQFATRSARRDPPQAKQSGGDSNKNSSASSSLFESIFVTSVR